MTAADAVDLSWAVWFLSWIAAAFWSARTRARPRRDVAGPHRLLIGVGIVLLFLDRTAPPQAPDGGVLDLLTRRMWGFPGVVEWTLAALVVASFGFCWWARLHLGPLWSGRVTVKEGHHVVDTGPYALVRHPIYSGVISAAAATALVHGAVASAIGAALVALGLVITARLEEGFLRQELGSAAYDAYSRRVGALLPKMAFPRRQG